MERELTKTQCTLVRLWMFGPILIAIGAFGYFCSVIRSYNGVALFALIAIAVVMFWVREGKYQYVFPRASRLLDLLFVFVVFFAISLWSDMSNPGYLGANFGQAIYFGGISAGFFAPHLLFRGVCRNTDQPSRT